MLFGQEFMPLEDLLFLGAASGGKLSELTASGNPCVFETDVARPLKSLALSLLPRQSGTGDPSPSNIRPLLPWGEVGTWTGGTNLFKITAQDKTTQGVTFTVNDDGTVSVSGTATGYVDFMLGEVPIPNKGKIHVSGVRTANNIAWSTIRLIDEDGIMIVDFASQAYFSDFVINLDNYPNAKTIRLGVKRADNKEVSGIITPMVQCADYDTAKAFEPYTPITPHPVNLGKNLFDKTAKDTSKGYASRRTLIYTGEMWDSNDFYVSEFIPCTSGTYTLSGVYGSNPAICFYDEDKQFLYGKKYNVFSETVRVMQATAPEGTCYCRISVPIDAENNVQLETGSEASPYQPYLPPVYGCELDLTTGEVWGTWVAITGKWGDAIQKTSLGDFTRGILRKQNAQLKYNGGGVSAKCNIISVRKWSYSEDSLHYYADNGSNYIDFTIFLPNDTPQETEIQGVFELATPVLLATLTPQQISAIVGVNTVWSDADNVDVTYLKKG